MFNNAWHSKRRWLLQNVKQQTLHKISSNIWLRSEEKKFHSFIYVFQIVPYNFEWCIKEGCKSLLINLGVFLNGYDPLT